MPFRFFQGINSRADTVMMGHLIANWMDKDVPASLDSKFVNMLRNDLGFDGAVVTDDLRMLTQAGYSLTDAARQAFIAGNDILWIVVDDPTQWQQLSDALVTAVDHGEVSKAELDAHLVRILTIKNKLIRQGEYVPISLYLD